MKIIIEDGHFSYQVDWAMNPELEEGEIPNVEECIDSFFRLLWNIYLPEKIADCLASGELTTLDYSPKGVAARDKLRSK